MEEEIIVPEETFEYNKLRYIVDNENYLLHASLGGLILCDLGECTEYIGEVPEGYETIEDWFDGENEKLNAWKIVDGNLAFDPVREAELKRKCKCEEEENSYATKKYVNEQLKSLNTIYDDELSSEIEGSSLFTINNTKATEIVEMLLTPNADITGNLKIKITSENMLGNKALNNAENGLTFEVNEDKSIIIDGTATEDVEYVLNGSSNSIDTLFFLKKNQDYMQCGLPKGVKINLYNYDGTDRNLISSMGNGTIKLSSTAYITYVTLYIAKGSKFEDVSIFPMIKVGTYSSNTKYEYIQCEENDILTIDLEDHTFNFEDTILIDRSSYLFIDKSYLFPSNSLYPNDDVFPFVDDTEITGYINTQKSFKGKTLIQCDKDVTMKVKYFTDDYLNEKFAAIEIKQDEIVSEVKRTYTTKEETATAKQEAINSSNTSTDNKLKNYSTTVEMNSAITQKANEINLEVGKKVNNEDFTGANIMLAINNDTSSAVISADKISLNGKEIDMTSEDISINSDNLKVDKNGNVTLYSDVRGAGDGSTSFTMQTRDTDNIAKLFPNLLDFRKDDGSCYIGNLGWPAVFLKNYNNDNQIAMQISNTLGASIRLGDSNDHAIIAIDLEGITTPTLTQTSKESKKKNIEEYKENALDIVKNSKIYTYHFKSEEDTEPKHIGFVIGDEGGDYKTPEQVVSKNKEGIDTYAEASILWKAVQEQQKIIEDLQRQINELKEVKQ